MRMMTTTHHSKAKKIQKKNKMQQPPCLRRCATLDKTVTKQWKKVCDVAGIMKLNLVFVTRLHSFPIQFSFWCTYLVPVFLSFFLQTHHQHHHHRHHSTPSPLCLPNQLRVFFALFIFTDIVCYRFSLYASTTAKSTNKVFFRFLDAALKVYQTFLHFSFFSVKVFFFKDFFTFLCLCVVVTLLRLRGTVDADVAGLLASGTHSGSGLFQ